MTITIFEGYSIDYVLLGSTDERFHKAFGNIVRTSYTNLYATMRDFTEWGKEIGEEIQFVID